LKTKLFSPCAAGSFIYSCPVYFLNRLVYYFFMKENIVASAVGSRKKVSHKERANLRLDTRTLLIRCGVELCTEKGFQVSGINDLLQRVGAPKGSFYHFFPSKHAFGEAVIDAYAEYFARKLSRHLDDTSLPALKRLANFVNEAQKGMEKFEFKRGCLVGNLGQELSSLDEDFRARLEAVLRSWERRTAECLREAVIAGDVTSEYDPETLANLFWIGWEGAILRAKLNKSAAPMQLFADIFFKKLLR
jgi:TetR/AcrR family transcriptional repressor of nem operon